MSMVERKFMGHYIDTSFAYVPGEAIPNENTKKWYRLGEDLDEYNVELNPSIAVARNMLGDDVLIHENYEMSGEAKTFYARENDNMYVALQNIIDNLSMNRACYTLALDVRLWEPALGVENGFKAFMRPCYVVPSYYGGDTSGYQIPFNVYYLNSFTTQGIFFPDGAGSGRLSVLGSL